MKIAIGGQLSKEEIKKEILKYGGDGIVADIFTDMDAAMKVKSGQYDYYFGACQSGAGGALGMAYGVLGRQKCFTVAMAGRPPKDEKVKDAVSKDGKAFGFTNDQLEASVAMLMKYLNG
ncbi:DUF2620 domain-containing protein [Oceanobacillus sojae]|uniref:DUF2620 domain-containing protein n=1 Tax=Oceanobacillus sojae TaxID=582851 RepID=UPI0021A37465|nr:DUF2620 domain-containing protein [Oceanobacillus sojae]MCT1902027.1 DUF2620 domain-containing protein [Oceanobacillus sojae]